MQYDAVTHYLGLNDDEVEINIRPPRPDTGEDKISNFHKFGPFILPCIALLLVIFLFFRWVQKHENFNSVSAGQLSQCSVRSAP